MCSALDDSTYWDAPLCTCGRPLSPDHEHRGSVALAILGDMLNDAENELEVGDLPYSWREIAVARVTTLRAARDRVAAAEAQS